MSRGVIRQGFPGQPRAISRSARRLTMDNHGQAPSRDAASHRTAVRFPKLTVNTVEHARKTINLVDRHHQVVAAHKRPTRGFEECIEDPAGSYTVYRDIDASVLVPSKDNRRYTTRIVDADLNPLTDLYGTDLGDGIILGSGNPADGNPLDTPAEDLSLGVQFEVRRVAGYNRWVVIAVNAAKADNTP